MPTEGRFKSEVESAFWGGNMEVDWVRRPANVEEPEYRKFFFSFKVKGFQQAWMVACGVLELGWGSLCLVWTYNGSLVPPMCVGLLN